MKIKSGNIALRPLKRNDAEKMAVYANNKEVIQYLASLPFPYSFDDALWFIKKAHREDRAGTSAHFAITLDDEFIGVISSDGLKKKVGEFGYWIAQQFWGKGIMSSAVKVFVEYLFTERKMHKIYAYVYTPNIASYKVLEKNGFEREGLLKEHIQVFGTWYDVHYYGLLRKDWETNKN